MKKLQQSATVAAVLYLTLVVGSGLTSAQTPEIRPLTEGQAIERELKGDEAHSYSLALTAGQFLNVVVEQKGIDVVVTLFDPNDKKVKEVDSPNGTHDPEPLSLITETTGNYDLEIRSLEKTAPIGRYEAKIVELRTATKKDEIKIAAQKAYSEGENMQLQPTIESWRSAIKKFEETSSLYRAIVDNSGEAKANTKIGYIYSLLNEKQKTLDYYNEALLLYRQSDDKNGEAYTLTNIGAVYFALKENQKALEYYLQALPLLRIARVQYDESATLNSIGAIYASLGENQKALEYYNKALSMLRAVRDKRHEARILLRIGINHLALRETQKALEYFSQALLLYKQVGDKRGETFSLSNILIVYSILGKKQKALNYSAQVLLILRAAGVQNDETATLNSIGTIYSSLGENQKALEYYLQAAITQSFAENADNSFVFHNLSKFWNSLNNPRLATFFGKIAVNNYQQRRTFTTGLNRSFQQSLLKSFEFSYRNLVNILIKQERFTEAHQVLNTFKDQQVFDLEQRRKLNRLAFTPREAEMVSRFDRIIGNIGTISGKIEELNHRIRNRPPNEDEAKQLQQLEIQLKTATDEFNNFIKQAETEFAAPPDEKDKVPEIADLKEMQTALRELSQSTGQKAAAVYTLVGKDEYKALLITADSVDAVSYPIKDAELNRKALQLWKLLQMPENDPQPIAAELYKIVFAPLAAKLPKDTKTILWSLDGNLRYVPMAALHDGKGYLVERFQNVLFTRSDRERLTRDVSRSWTGNGFGSSKAHTVELLGTKVEFAPLLQVEFEMSRIFKQAHPKGIFNGDVLLDEKFTKPAMLAALKNRRPLVHIASHFKFEPGDEARSFLLLGNGELMTLDEMKREQQLFAGVELLTLSACQTAAQRPDANGREIDAFAELAQRLGAGAVMASLWDLSDNSTAELMARFYRNYNTSKISKAEALRNAQLALLKGFYKDVPQTAQRKAAQEEDMENIKIEKSKLLPYKRSQKAPFAHPFYWSPFVLVGNWK